MENIAGWIIGIGYFILGIIQWFAIVDGLEYWFGISGFFAVILSFIISYLPLIGTVAGFIGAMNVWGWSLIEAGALFFGPLIIIFALVLVSSVFEKN